MKDKKLYCLKVYFNKYHIDEFYITFINAKSELKYLTDESPIDIVTKTIQGLEKESVISVESADGTNHYFSYDLNALKVIAYKRREEAIFEIKRDFDYMIKTVADVDIEDIFEYQEYLERKRAT